MHFFIKQQLKAVAVSLYFALPLPLLSNQAPNPLEESLVGVLRDRTTSRKDFQDATKQLAHFLVARTTQYLDIDTKNIKTPLAPFTSTVIKKNPILVPILRSGLALLPEFQMHYKGASVGFLGFKRDEQTAIASRYYSNLPPIKSDDRIIVLEPMLATGGTLMQAITLLKSAGASEEHIIIACVICAPEGLARLQQEFPKINIVSCALDTCLNSRSYIVPGLGDFGDRFFGTDEPAID